MSPLSNNILTIIIIVLSLIVVSISSTAQNSHRVEGVVLRHVGDTLLPLPFANVYWLESGTHMKTDIQGRFHFTYFDQVNATLLATSVGYNKDIIKLSGQDAMLIFYLHSITEMTFTKLSTPIIKIDSRKVLNPIFPEKKESFLSKLFHYRLIK